MVEKPTEIRTARVFVTGLVGFVRRTDSVRALLVKDHHHVPKIEVALGDSVDWSLGLCGYDLRVGWRPKRPQASSLRLPSQRNAPEDEQETRNRDWMLRLKDLVPLENARVRSIFLEGDLNESEAQEVRETLAARVRLRNGALSTARLAEWEDEKKETRVVTLKDNRKKHKNYPRAASSCVVLDLVNPHVDGRDSEFLIEWRRFGAEQWESKGFSESPGGGLDCLISNSYRGENRSMHVEHFVHYMRLLSRPPSLVPDLEVDQQLPEDLQPSAEKMALLKFFPPSQDQAHAQEDAIKITTIFRPPICPGLEIEG